MELFYTDPEHVDLNARKLEIEGDEFHHLVRVLRKKEGDQILVTDGNGLRCEVRIVHLVKRSLVGEILTTTTVDPPKTAVTIALSMLKAPQRFDFFLEKATELGVSSIIPMITARTISLPSSDKVQGKLNRWRTILLSASRQSKRYYLPQLYEPLSFSKVLAFQGYDLRLIPYESAEVSPKMRCAGQKILFLIGGEGGFTEGEVAAAEAGGCRPISFGTTILRAETAGIFAVASVRLQLLQEHCKEWF